MRHPATAQGLLAVFRLQGGKDTGSHPDTLLRRVNSSATYVSSQGIVSYSPVCDSAFCSSGGMEENRNPNGFQVITRPSRFLLALTSVWFIAAAAFAARLAFLDHQQSVIPHQVLATVPFEQEAGNTAFALSQGQGFSNLFRQNTGPTAWLAPAYPSLLSLIFRVFGAFTFSSFIAAASLNALFSAATTFPLFYLSQKISGRSAAIAVAWLWVFLPAGILMPSEWIWDTSLSVLLVATILWLTFRISESPKLSLWFSYALLWAVTLLTNPAIGVALPFLFLWATYRARARVRLSAKIPALTFALIVLCCLPWTIRNYTAFHRVIPIRSSLPLEFWIGNNDLFDPHAVGGIQRITRYEEIHRYAQLGENAYLAEKSQLASAFIRRNPILVLRLTAKRIIATWIGTEHPFTDFLGTNSPLVRTVFVCNFILTLGTLFGIWFLSQVKNPYTFPVTVFPALYPIIFYFTHTSLRYRHPIDPILLLLTVLAVVNFPRRNQTKLPAPSAL
jgi:hypothetical protein